MKDTIHLAEDYTCATCRLLSSTRVARILCSARKNSVAPCITNAAAKSHTSMPLRFFHPMQLYCRPNVRYVEQRHLSR